MIGSSLVPMWVEIMQLAVTIALTVLYVGLSLTLGGVHPKGGMPWWFFVPSAVAFFASGVAMMIFGKLPKPWANGRRYGSPPRRVHLSWRSAVWLPVWPPALLVPWHFLSILRMQLDLDGVWYLAVPMVLAVLALVARKRRREIRLLRGGEVAMAFVDRRERTGEWTDRIAYSFSPHSAHRCSPVRVFFLPSALKGCLGWSQPMKWDIREDISCRNLLSA